ncbi:MAG: YihY/virulence factor BrkB family protein [Gammaproteobacteria bacterium]|nr:YihY/virulence factor BrkB family protein [Gammaproteobacteria bacterium]
MAETADTDRGRMAARPGEIPRPGWRDILLRVKQEVGRDNLSIVAAGAAFYALFALFPAVGALVAIYGLFASPESVQQHMQMLETVMPEQARTLLNQQLQRVVSSGSTALGIGALLGILIALWSAAKGVKALMTALNIVYEEEEKRGFFKLNLTALFLTFLVLAFVLIALAAIAVLPAIIGSLGLPAVAEGLARWLRWPLLALVCVGILGLLYRYAASRAHPQWRWVLWGAAVATALWLIGSALFSWYVTNFGSYNETFGSVAAVAVLMMWFWLSAYFVLIGAELNAEMEHQTRRDTTTGKPKPLGSRRAHVADTIGESPGRDEGA